ncbi:MAG: hypothetical protein QM756_28415 [Polyangiaceae bacterium]
MLRNLALSGVALALLLACSGNSESSANQPATSGSGGANFGAGGASAAVPGASAGSAGRAAEVEDEGQYLAPVTTGKYLWSANQLSGRVALIDAETLSVKLEVAGNRPTQVLGLESDGRLGALVLNDFSDDATLLRVSADGALERVRSFATQADANAWVASPSGNYAIAWSNVALKASSTVGALDLFQDITLFTLSPGSEAAYRLSVGARPSRFVFDAAEQYAYAVTEEGISVIELAARPRVSGVIPLTTGLVAERGAADVSFAPDGSYALVRTRDSSLVTGLALPDGARRARFQRNCYGFGLGARRQARLRRARAHEHSGRNAGAHRWAAGEQLAAPRAFGRVDRRGGAQR